MLILSPWGVWESKKYFFYVVLRFFGVFLYRSMSNFTIPSLNLRRDALSMICMAQKTTIIGFDYVKKDKKNFVELSWYFFFLLGLGISKKNFSFCAIFGFLKFSLTPTYVCSLEVWECQTNHCLMWDMYFGDFLLKLKNVWLPTYLSTWGV